MTSSQHKLTHILFNVYVFMKRNKEDANAYRTIKNTQIYKWENSSKVTFWRRVNLVKVLLKRVKKFQNQFNYKHKLDQNRRSLNF